MPSFRDLSEIVEDLSCRELPFTWYAMGPVGNAVEFDVATRDFTVASAYFVKHPQALVDGTPVPVLVRPRRGESWVSPPSSGVVEPSNVLDHATLSGVTWTRRRSRRTRPDSWYALTSPKLSSLPTTTRGG